MFTFITLLYQLCRSLVIIECYILMLYHNCITLIYFIAVYVLFVSYVQRRTTTIIIIIIIIISIIVIIVIIIIIIIINVAINQL